MTVTVTNQKTTFDADTNADIAVDVGAGAAGLVTQRTILATDGNHATAAHQVTAQTSLTNIENSTDLSASSLSVLEATVTSEAAAFSFGVGVLGYDGSVARRIATDTVGTVAVNVLSGGGGVQYTEDDAAAADPVGSALNLIRADIPGAVTTTDGDNVAARGTNKGELYVKHIDSIPVTGTVAATQSGAWSLSANQSVNVAQINGVATSMGNGASGTGVQRVTLANDSTGVLATVSTVTTVGTVTNITNQGQLVDNAGFTDGTTRIMMNGYIYDEVAGTALTENDGAAARINVNRAQIGIIEDGTTRGRYATVSAANALKVDGSAVTQPVSIAATVTTSDLAASAATRTQVSDTITDGIILAANASRIGATVENDSSATLYLGLGTTAVTTTNYTVKLVQNAYYEVPKGFTGQIRGLWASDPNDGAARVTEF